MDFRIWNGVEIHRSPADGYVNATAMCHAGQRRWNHYQANDRTKSYIAALAAVTGFPATGIGGLIRSIQGGRPELQGTWIHPRLAVDLARWISPAFAVWMDGWFLEVVQAQAQGAAAQHAGAQGAQTQGARAAAAGTGATPLGGAATAFGFSAVTAPADWNEIVAAYATEVEAAIEGRAAHEVPRSLRYARPVATHFMGWLVQRYAQLVLPPTCKPALPVAGDFSAAGSVAALPATPAIPATPTPADLPVRRRRRSDAVAAPAPLPEPDPWQAAQPPETMVCRHLRPIEPDQVRRFRRGEQIAGPELARILGITTHRINDWSRHHGIGASRDGWQLIGQGKIGCGDLGSTLPPGRPSWLFERL
jgi:hypothetical protein